MALSLFYKYFNFVFVFDFDFDFVFWQKKLNCIIIIEIVSLNPFYINLKKGFIIYMDK